MGVRRRWVTTPCDDGVSLRMGQAAYGVLTHALGRFPGKTIPTILPVVSKPAQPEEQRRLARLRQLERGMFFCKKSPRSICAIETKSLVSNGKVRGAACCTCLQYRFFSAS